MNPKTFPQFTPKLASSIVTAQSSEKKRSKIYIRGCVATMVISLAWLLFSAFQLGIHLGQDVTKTDQSGLVNSFKTKYLNSS